MSLPQSKTMTQRVFQLILMEDTHTGKRTQGLGQSSRDFHTVLLHGAVCVCPTNLILNLWGHTRLRHTDQLLSEILLLLQVP